MKGRRKDGRKEKRREKRTDGGLSPSLSLLTSTIPNEQTLSEETEMIVRMRSLSCVRRRWGGEGGGRRRRVHVLWFYLIKFSPLFSFYLFLASLVLPLVFFFSRLHFPGKLAVILPAFSPSVRPVFSSLSLIFLGFPFLLKVIV